MRGYKEAIKDGWQHRFNIFRAHLRKTEEERILRQKRTNSQVLIAYHWRRYWAKVQIEELRAQKEREGSKLDFQKMSIIEMQLMMQQKR
jgi:hypothetical protein